MICIKAEIPKELNDIDDELKAIYHSKDTVCFYIFKTRELRNEFIEKTKGMDKDSREQIYKDYYKIRIGELYEIKLSLVELLKLRLVLQLMN
jgi:hypothetical protein